MSTYVAFSYEIKDPEASTPTAPGFGSPAAWVLLRAGLGFVVAFLTSLLVEYQHRKHGDKLLAPSVVRDLRLHDLRRTAASLMTGMGISRLTVKKILNHAERDVTAVYDRHSYDPEKRSALEAWGRRLEAIVSGQGSKGQVVTMGARRRRKLDSGQSPSQDQHRRMS